ncbi:JAB domain-containing protein [Enterococcus sp. HY326]|uniref:JAB domain-containing protein n=1 Tax=Enterococcus sp. HY326 TaxID=2971265 RepID=UPI00223F0661|nr:JAB domain-containing protein [Enterococcus sp. HY326]
MRQTDSYIPQKRVAIVHLEIVKESSILYAERVVDSPHALYQLFAPFIQKKDREHLIVAGLNARRKPTFIHLAHIGGLNQSLAIPRDILKPALLSNSISVVVGHNHPSSISEHKLVELSLADIDIVKNGSLTVYPFPFKLLREYISNESRKLRVGKGN